LPTSRTRSMDERKFFSGTRFHRIASPQTQSSFTRYSGNWGTCEDVVGNRQGVNPLGLTKKFAYTPVLNGKLFDSFGLFKAFYNHPIDLEVTPIQNPTTRFANYTSLQLNTMTWQALAKSNPSAPTVSVPTFLAELKDLPGLYRYLRQLPTDLRRFYHLVTLVPTAIRYWGSNLIRQVARGYITWRWALRPMLSDLRTMFDFMSSVDKRMKQLERLKKTGSLRTRVSLGQEMISEADASVFLHTNLDTWKALRMTRTTRKTWFCCRWSTTGFTSIPTDYNARLWLARRLTYGITSYEALATLWEILPWSWFVDWFIGIGTMIEANNNVLNLVQTGSCIMSTRESETSWPVTQKGTWSTLSGTPYALWTIKERWSSTPSLPLAPTLDSFLKWDRWSILTSLYVLNRGRRVRRKVEIKE
jgi:hypothetical protein